MFLSISCLLAALLHDVKDYKYSGSDTAAEEAVSAFLAGEGYAPTKVLQPLFDSFSIASIFLFSIESIL